MALKKFSWSTELWVIFGAELKPLRANLILLVNVMRIRYLVNKKEMVMPLRNARYKNLNVIETIVCKTQHKKKKSIENT